MLWGIKIGIVFVVTLNEALPFNIYLRQDKC